MKNINKFTIGAAILTTLPLLAFAQTPTGTVNGSVISDPSVRVIRTNAASVPRTGNPTPIIKDVAYYIQKGDAAIAERIADLNKRITALDGQTHLTAEQIAIIKAPLVNAIAAMNAAKAKLDADTDLATAKADYAAIFKDNRINMVILPQERAIKSTSLDGYRLATSTAYSVELQAKIDAAKALGKDVTAAQAALDAGKAKLATVSTKITYELSEAAKLVVDHGDKTLVAANKVADANVKAARKAINVAFEGAKADWKAVLVALSGSDADR